MAKGREYEINTYENNTDLLGPSEKFLSQEQVKEYNNALLTAIKTRHSLRLGEPEYVRKMTYEYFDLCKKTNQLPSIKALGLYLGVTFDTLKKYLTDPTSPYFNALSLARDMCHVVIENGAMNNKVNPATYMFTAANYYGMKNTQSVEINRGTSETEKALAQSEESLNALKKLISNTGVEDKINADAIDADSFVKVSEVVVDE